MSLSVRARNLLDTVAKLPEPTSEEVAAWIRAHVPAGHNHVARMQQFLRKQQNCGEETASEILGFAFGDDILKRRRVRLMCSTCGETANLQSSGEMCDKFQRWWVEEHKHERV